jgi:hypothetical protein
MDSRDAAADDDDISLEQLREYVDAQASVLEVAATSGEPTLSEEFLDRCLRILTMADHYVPRQAPERIDLDSWLNPVGVPVYNISTLSLLSVFRSLQVSLKHAREEKRSSNKPSGKASMEGNPGGPSECSQITPEEGSGPGMTASRLPERRRHRWHSFD